MIAVTETVALPDSELEWATARSGGPGGQNVNKVESKVVLRWKLAASAAVGDAAKERIRRANPSKLTQEGELLVTSQKTRDQERNREDCALKLAEIVRRGLVEPTPRRPTKPTKGSQRRRLADKKRQSEKKAGRRPAGGE